MRIHRGLRNSKDRLTPQPPRKKGLTLFAEILIYGLMTSAVYAMLAVGLTLMIGIARVMNLAHGTFYMLGAYGVFALSQMLNWPLPLAIGLAVLGVGALALLLNELCLRPIEGSMDTMMVLTLILALLFEEVTLLIFGPAPVSNPPIISGSVALGDVTIAAQRLLVVGVASATLLGLWWFIAKTRTGGAFLAVAQDLEAASLMGVNSRNINRLIQIVAAIFAAGAGIVVSPFLSTSPDMWLWPFVKAFTIVILGGIGSVAGSILAAFILGFSETIVSFSISPRVTELVALAILFLVIVLRPSGLMGTRSGR